MMSVQIRMESRGISLSFLKSCMDEDEVYNLLLKKSYFFWQYFSGQADNFRYDGKFKAEITENFCKIVKKVLRVGGKNFVINMKQSDAGIQKSFQSICISFLHEFGTDVIN